MGIGGRMKIMISMPDNMAKYIDEFANKENRSRSELIREALRTYISKAKLREKAINSDIFID